MDGPLLSHRRGPSIGNNGSERDREGMPDVASASIPPKRCDASSGTARLVGAGLRSWLYCDTKPSRSLAAGAVCRSNR
jgi:hypothetical protein